MTTGLLARFEQFILHSGRLFSPFAFHVLSPLYSSVGVGSPAIFWLLFFFGEQPPVAMDLVQVIANPRIFGEPFVICMTKRTKRPAKEDRTGVKAGTVDLYSGGNRTPGYGALDEQDAHERPSRKAL
jgi:hypothetical protein